MPSRAATYRPRKAPRPTTERPKTAERGYNAAWRAAAAAFLRRNPLCAACAIKGRITAARVVDHKVPHRGDRELFHDEGNWQSLCCRCHNSKSARERLSNGQHR